MRRLTLWSLVVALVWTAAPAAAQEYAQETGDLEFTLSLVVDFSGDGYAADSTVLLTLVPEGSDGATDMGTLEVDSTGAFTGSITLPDGLAPGRYMLAATGVTEDGATRILSAGITIGGEPGPDTSTTTTTTVPESTSTTSPPTTTASGLPQSVIDALLEGFGAVRGVAGS